MIDINLHGNQKSPAALLLDADSTRKTKFPDYHITSFSLNVDRNFLGETYSFGNTYILSFQGVIFDPINPNLSHDGSTKKNLSATIKSKINDMFDDSKFDFKVKSLSFPSNSATTSDQVSSAKFSITFEGRELIKDNHKRFVDNAKPKVDSKLFNDLIPAKMIQPFGNRIKDFSESFNIEDSEDGQGTFTHSINFVLIPDPPDVTHKEKSPPAKPIRPTKDSVNAFRSSVENFTAELTEYKTFAQLTTLFDKDYSNFEGGNAHNFFTESKGFINSETFDLFGLSYSLTRTKKFAKASSPSSADADMKHSYTLVVNQDGVIDITEETRLDGKKKNFNDVDGLIESLVESPLSTKSGHDGNSYTKVGKSFTRCMDFLEKNKRLLRYTNNADDFGNYTNASKVDSLKPIAIEKNKTSITGSPNIVYTVKYTTNPNVNFAFECDERIKIEVQNQAYSAVHSFALKVFSFKDKVFSTFDASLGSNSKYGSTFLSFKNEKIKKSLEVMNKIFNGSPSGNPLLSPFDSMIGFARGMKSNPLPQEHIPMAMIRQSSSVSKRGKNFSLSFSYSSENKYGPLLKEQATNAIYGPSPFQGDKMFTNLGIDGAYDFLKNNFTTFDVKVSKKMPVEKFTQRVIIEKPHAIIDPSFATSTGYLTMTFSGKLRRDKAITNHVGAFPDKSSQIASLVYGTIFGGGLAQLKVIAMGICGRELEGNDHVMKGEVINIDRAPISATYKYDSDLNLEVTIELEFSGKHTKIKPLFLHKANKIT